MAKRSVPRHENGLASIPQEHILLPVAEITEKGWPVRAIRFNRDLCILIIDVDEMDLISRLIGEPALTELSEYGFQPKQGLHMTVINFENGGQILGALKSEPLTKRKNILQTIEDAAVRTDWSWQPTGRLRSFQGRKEKTLKIITRVECPAFGTYYEELRRLIPTAEFKLYPPHITVLKQLGEVNGRASSRIGGVALNQPLLSLNYSKIE